MLLSLIYFAVRRLLCLLATGDRDDAARDVEILVLRHQLRLLSRGRRLPLRRSDRILLAAASRLLSREMWRSFPVSPRTVLRWHRELVRRKWTYRHRRRLGRPRVAKEVATLILGLARENPRWGYLRIQGELKKLGISVSATGICSVLRRHGLPPAPRRDGPSWKEFLAQQAAGILVCDFFFRGNRMAQDSLRSLLHRALDPQGARDRGHRPSLFCLGYPAGPQPRDRESVGWDPVPDPRPRRQVLGVVGRGISLGRSAGHPDADTLSESEDLRI